MNLTRSIFNLHFFFENRFKQGTMEFFKDYLSQKGWNICVIVINC